MKQAGIAKFVILLLFACLLGFFALALYSPLRDGQSASKRWFLLKNMKMVVTAVDSYAKDHDGNVPSEMNQLEKYFPGGPAVDGHSKSGETTLAPGSPPVNPYNLKPEWPKLGNFATKAEAVQSLSKVVGRGELYLVKTGRSKLDYVVIGSDGRPELIIYP